MKRTNGGNKTVTLNHDGSEKYNVKHGELVRVLLQSLENLGYEKTRQMLESESGVHMESKDVICFKKCVLNGDWKRSIEMLSKLPLAHRAENVFEILKQKFLEYLCEDKIKDAILCLQDEVGRVVESSQEKSFSSSQQQQLKVLPILYNTYIQVQ